MMVSGLRKRTGPLEIPNPEIVQMERKRIHRFKRYKSVLANTVGILLVVAASAVLLVSLFLPVLQVAGTSMEPTLENSDVIVLAKTSNFKTGDLCAVRVSGNILLKRMIAGPGDWVNIDSDGNVYVNGTLLDEPYITDKSLGTTDLTYPYQVPDNSIFVMGDHRSVSLDSRSSEIGCIRYEQVIGRILFRIWPLSEISWLL